MYVVDVRLNADGDIIHTDCDCPVEDDCKHIVATLYAIQDPKTFLQRYHHRILLANLLLKEYLQSQTKEQLIAYFKSGQNHLP